jgi:hypothetical protein
MVLTPKSDNPTELLHVPRLIFLGEQDGPPERELKTLLAQLFDHEGGVLRAYLAQVSYGDSANSVALCVRVGSQGSKRLVEKIGKVFGGMFGEHEHLDIIFLDDAQEGSLKTSCSAFFNSPAD